MDNNYYKHKYLKYKIKYNKLKSNNHIFNYYGKRDDEVILDRKLYECPIFSTHNTFIWRKSDTFGGIFTEEALENDILFDYIDYILNLTLLFPVCIEIDNKLIFNIYSCKLGHGIKYSNTFIGIKELSEHIIEKYNNIVQDKYPLIIHYDSYKDNCLEDILHNSKFSNTCLDEPCELSTKTLRECMNKIVIRTKSSIKINFYYINYVKSKGINFNLINEINKLTSIKEICEKLKIVGDKEYLYRLYPTMYKQIDISKDLVKLIITLFNYNYEETILPNYNLPTLITFNLFDLYNEESALLEQLKSKFIKFYS